MIRDGPFVPYVQSAISQDVPPPYHFPNVRVNTFIWPADMAKVQAYCDTYLNLGTAAERGFHYRPLAAWPYATLMFLDYPEMISSARDVYDFGETPYPDRGITSQREAFVAIPVIRYGTNPLTAMTRAAVEWIVPVIVVSEPWSSVCGREMLGLGKLLAEIDFGENEEPESFFGKVRLPGWKDGAPHEVQAYREFVTVTTGAPMPSATPQGDEQSLYSLFDTPQAASLFETMSKLSNFVNFASLGTIPTVMRTVGLKQYRDAKHPDKAVYQALVTCRSYFSNLRSIEFYSEQDVDISFNSEGSFRQIISTLISSSKVGLGATMSTHPVAAFRFCADIDYDQMRVIHEFPIDGIDGIQPRVARSDLAAAWFRPMKGLLEGLFKR
ncbi:acetoacetate decarboxylase family protein [Qipengyuania aurantiaca]|uniref:Acetoacetate decarboxylase family protein n=1 Tax=Qipengyuania aurantiaca TaxID=2867233 RepID=A0ABX8ZJX7_9SPHN|nr:acetoacetate decarboxylase family protein [Qipengyuania aurantiaca]QZD89305.1 acetoacetate decarboxylase family protein [Qipengyuania aurantiaca]